MRVTVRVLAMAVVLVLVREVVLAAALAVVVLQAPLVPQTRQCRFGRSSLDQNQGHVDRESAAVESCRD